MTFNNTPELAHELDQADPLKSFREKFHIPQVNGSDAIYFCGNSLGLQPKTTQAFIQNELIVWKERAVEGHFTGSRPWADYHKLSKKSLSNLVGGKESEVVAMNNLTTNLHLLLASFYQPSGKRVKLLIEHGAFPSDHYAAESHMKQKGVNPDEHLITISPKAGKLFQKNEIEAIIADYGDELALVMLPGVQYYTGQYFDMKSITAAAHQVGAYGGFDLAHAIGNLPLSLHEWEVDFATWCSYKYVNSGPGGISGIYVHEKHANNPDFPKLTGWWGHDRQTRFRMDNKFVPNPGVDSWMLSNGNIISAAAHLASLEIFDQTNMEELRDKSIRLTGYLEFLMLNDPDIQKHIEILTPADPQSRGCQLSVFIDQHGKTIFDGLIEAGVILDWREPNVIRVAPTPLYNTFRDVYKFCEIFKNLILKYA
ncbi:MAG: kynureninase [Marinoscillum sp.]